MNVAAAAVRRPVLTLMIALIVVTLGLFALGKIPLDLMPEMTYPTISISTAYENASPREVEELISKPLEQAVAAIPGAEEITSTSIEGQSTVSVKFGWGHNLDEGTNDIRDRLQVELRGNDLEESGRLSDLMEKIMKSVPGVADVYVSYEDAATEEVIVIDRDRAADADLSVAAVSSLIRTAVAGSTAGNYREDGKEYAIRVILKDSDKLAIEELMSLTLTNGGGEQVALGNVARAVPGQGPLKISRKNQARTVTFYADYSGRPLGDVIGDVDAALRTLPLPPEFSYAFAGEAKERNETFRELSLALLLAVFLVYMVMAGQFEQWKGPLVVMVSVPMAAIGVIFSHWVTGTNFNINSFIGVIMLAGIVVNNAIILIDQANRLRRYEQMEIDAALMEAGRRRLRPILMTTLTTILGLLPLSLGFGEGGETQASLASAVIGGLTSSTFITLFVVPAVYKLMRPGIRTRSEKARPIGETLKGGL